jgi:hypothetical protein
VQQADGSGGNYSITFTNGPWAYTFDNIVMGADDEKSGLFLNISKDGKDIVRYTCVEMK